MRPVLSLLCALIACSLALVSPLHAQEPPNVEEVVLADPEEHLLGDLGRGKLEEEGVRIEAFALHDFWANVAGGLSRGGGVMGNMNLILSLDTAKMGWWEDGAFVLWGIGVYGRRSSEVVGDFQYTSSIDAPDSVELYEAYYEHSFMNGSIDVLAGIHDFSLEFAILDYAYTLINSSFVTPPTITQYPVSFYPTTGLGTRASLTLSDELYGLIGAYDGEPANFNDYRETTWSISKGEGIYSIAEIGWKEDEDEKPYTKVALGGWFNSGHFTDATGQERTGNYGTYLLAERQVWQEEKGSKEGLGMFLQVSQARNDRNTCPWYYGTGLSYTGLFPGRDEDVAAVGLADAFFSSNFKDYYDTDDESERVWELNYRIRVLSSTTITPDVQYVMNPNANPDTRDALIFYLRTEVAL
jgi:porin